MIYGKIANALENTFVMFARPRIFDRFSYINLFVGIINLIKPRIQSAEYIQESITYVKEM